MAQPVFALKFTPTSASPVDDGVWDLVGTVVDANGNFNGTEVQVGDVIVLDTEGSVSGTVSTYKILEVLDAGFSDIEVRVQYNDGDEAIDPSGALFVDGVLGRASVITGMVWIPANDIQGFPAKLVTFAANIVRRTIIDPGIPEVPPASIPLDANQESAVISDLTFSGTQYKSASFQYSLVTASGHRRAGVLEVVVSGPHLSAPTGVEYVDRNREVGGDCGVQFDVVLNGTDVDIRYTTDGEQKSLFVRATKFA